MIELALLRHGHTPWNRDGRLQGRTDIPLDPEARATLEGLRLPSEWQGASLWSSPLSRAVETARIVSGRPPRTDDRLIEMNWGDWEGKKREDLFADPAIDYRHIDTWGWHYTPPNGESPATMKTRLLSWVQELDGQNIAVCHIGVMRVLLALAHDWNFDGPAPFTIKRNRLYVLQISGNSWSALAEPVRLIEAA